MNSLIVMKHFLPGLWLSVLLSACAGVRGAEDVVRGKEALLAGDYQSALGYFQQAEQVDRTIYMVRSYGKASRALWEEPNISPETIHKRGSLCTRHFPSSASQFDVPLALCDPVTASGVRSWSRRIMR